jgi:hypothetical protein
MMKRYHFRRTVVQGAFVTAETEQDARRYLDSPALDFWGVLDAETPELIDVTVRETQDDGGA